jgi:predicted RNA binding protein YcfA (HicA-like mRNA interferase family)
MADLGKILDILAHGDALSLDDRTLIPERPRTEGQDLHPVDVEGLMGEEIDHAEWNDFDPDVVDRVLSGDSRLRDRAGAVPAIEVLAWYQPIHFFGNQWGIFIREEGLLDLAADLAASRPSNLQRSNPHADFWFLVRSAFSFLFLHEQYHHKIESAAIRMHITEQRPVYPRYARAIWPAVGGTNRDLEEALANADAHYRFGTQKPYSNFARGRERAYVRDWMEDLFANSPPGYKRALNYLRRSSFDPAEGLLLGQVQEATETPRRRSTDDFMQAEHLTHSLFNLKQNVWTLVPKGARSILPSKDLIPGLTRIRLERFLRKTGWEETALGKGSHSVWRRDGSGMITLPHQKDLSKTVLKSTAKTLGMTVHDLAHLSS